MDFYCCSFCLWNKNDCWVKFDMLLFTRDEFQMVTGTDLSLELEEDDDPGNEINRFINHAIPYFYK